MLNSPKMPTAGALAAYIGLLSFACFFAAIIQWQRDKRILVSTPTEAVVEETWLVSGKGGGTFAALSFQREQAGKTIQCHANKVRVGPSSRKLTVGQTIKIAPRTDSCYEPDIFDDRPPWPSNRTLILIGAAAGLIALFLTRSAYRKALAAQKADWPA